MMHMIATMGVQSATLFLQAPNGGGLTPDQQFQIAREALRAVPDNNRLVSQLVPIAFFAMIGLIVWLGIRHKNERVRINAELRKQLLDKFGSAQELTVFLESKGGRQFLEERRSPRGGHLRFVSPGVILTMLGLAFLGLTLTGRHFIVPAVILMALGIGFLISGAISYKLGEKDAGDSISPGSENQPVRPA